MSGAVSEGTFCCMPLVASTHQACGLCCRVTFALGGLAGARADEGHPERGSKYVPPAKLPGAMGAGDGQGLASPPKFKFTKQDARELEELLYDADQIYAPSVSRLKRRHVFFLVRDTQARVDVVELLVA